MISENLKLQQRASRTEPRPAAASGLHLNAKERKLLLLGGDLLLLNVALVAAVTLWNGFPLSTAALWDHNKWFLTLSGLWWVVATILDVYNLARAASVTSTLASVGSAALLTTGLYLAIPWFSPPIFRRLYVFGLVLLITVALLSWRIFYARALSQPAFRQQGLVVGNGGAISSLVRAINEASQSDNANPFRGTGYAIAGWIVDEGTVNVRGDIPLLGDARRLVRLARQTQADEIILAFEDERELSLEARQILLDCRELGLRISHLSSVYERLTGRLPVDYAHWDLQLLLSPADSPAFRLHLAVKRALDILLALLGLAVLGGLLPFVALANGLLSPGPLFYRQERSGRGGRPFTLIKLRSMVRDAERLSGAIWCGEHDPRVTPVGRLLRKTRLDELPQVINVLRGEMSIVGPRPERPHFVGQLSHIFPLYRARHSVKPGITGWAQVHYEYGDSVEDARIKLEYDLYYVKHASLYLDLLILLHTVRVIFGLKGQ